MSSNTAMRFFLSRRTEIAFMLIEKLMCCILEEGQTRVGLSNVSILFSNYPRVTNASLSLVPFAAQYPLVFPYLLATSIICFLNFRHWNVFSCIEINVLKCD